MCAERERVFADLEALKKQVLMHRRTRADMQHIYPCVVCVRACLHADSSDEE